MSALFPSHPISRCQWSIQHTEQLLHPHRIIIIPHLFQFSNSSVSQQQTQCRPATPFSACWVLIGYCLVPLLFFVSSAKGTSYYTVLAGFGYSRSVNLLCSFVRRYILQHTGSEKSTLFSLTISLQLYSNLFEKLL